LEERIEMLEKQKKFMQDKLRKAGARIKDLEAISKSHQKLVGSLLTDKKKPQWDDTE
jgi:chaperonin cofactor prefoldin